MYKPSFAGEFRSKSSGPANTPPFQNEDVWTSFIVGTHALARLGWLGNDRLLFEPFQHKRNGSSLARSDHFRKSITLPLSVREY